MPKAYQNSFTFKKRTEIFVTNSLDFFSLGKVVGLKVRSCKFCDIYNVCVGVYVECSLNVVKIGKQTTYLLEPILRVSREARR